MFKAQHSETICLQYDFIHRYTVLYGHMVKILDRMVHCTMLLVVRKPKFVACSQHAIWIVEQQN